MQNLYIYLLKKHQQYIKGGYKNVRFFKSKIFAMVLVVAMVCSPLFSVVNAATHWDKTNTVYMIAMPI